MTIINDDRQLSQIPCEISAEDHCSPVIFFTELLPFSLVFFASTGEIPSLFWVLFLK